MFWNRIRLGVAFATMAAVAATTAFAQQGTQTAPKPKISVAPGTTTAKAPTMQVQQDPATVARNTDATLSCTGPLRLEVLQRDQFDGSKGVEMKLIFTEAASATAIQPGQCWRTGGFSLSDGVLLGGGKGKGEMAHAPDLKKCPLMKSYTIEGGKLKDAKVNDGTIAYTMVDAAQSTGRINITTRWIDQKGGVNPGSGASGHGRYSIQFGDAVTPGVPGCR